MNILQISNKAIYPPDGGTQAILSMSKGYVRNGHNVHLLNMTTPKHYNNISIIEKEYLDHLKIITEEVNTKISVLRLLLNFFFSKKPYIAKRFYTNKFSERITELIKTENFDFIQIEGLYVLQYIHIIKSGYKGNIVYRPHNLEYKIWESNSKESSNILKKIYFKVLSNKLRKFEQRFLNLYDYILPISDKDAVDFEKEGNIKPVLVSPYGFDTIALAKAEKNDTKSGTKQINYIGALDWIPNQEGIIWFTEKCMPLIVKEIPNIELHIAGRNAPKWFIKKLKRKNINFIGEVENAYEFIQNPGPIIVPLFSGSGMRIKIIEAMAFKKTVIATPIAAEGINYENNVNIVIANNPESFANSIIKTIQNTNFEKEIGMHAFEFAKKNFDFENIAANIISFIK
ncbi:MAG: glycosyltransferase family 4 protein [Bacteroidales bacterium]|nr:glycosyltransferase family 4 protein [Bacteroidales bacterium]